MKPDANEGVHREGGVADPGVAVVPVARAADDFGQAAGRGGDDRAGRLEGEQLQGEGGALDALAPAAAVGAAGEPVLPEFYGALEGLLGFAFGGGRGGRRGFAVVLEDEGFGLAFFENEFRGDAARAVGLQRRHRWRG